MNTLLVNQEIGHFYSNDVDGNVIVKEIPLSISKKHQLYYRKDTSDLNMLKESWKDYINVDCKDQVVMDCGSNIGGFISKACIDGALAVYAYEPEQFNFDVLSKNVSILKEKFNTQIEIINSALIGSAASYVTFNINGAKTSACSGSVIKTRRSIELNVKAVNFWDELERIRPSIVKMDIEGGEYGVLTKDFPEYVKEVALELHGWRVESNRQMMDYIDSIKNNPLYEIVNLEFINVFSKPKLALLHFKRK